MAQEWTPERRQAFADKMKASRAAKAGAKKLLQADINKKISDADAEVAKNKLSATYATPPHPDEAKVPLPEDVTTPPVETTQREQDLEKQVNELKDMMLKVLAGQATQGNNPQLNNSGRLVGEIEKYSVDVSRYPDFTQRLAAESRLAPLAFSYNYELDYSVSERPYENKGINYKEPEFLVTLYRIVLDENGEQTQKRYIAKRLMFHEDPQAAIVIARNNGINLDDWKDLDNSDTNQRAFLNEMRYIRARDWLFDIFWPKPSDKTRQIREESIGGTIVQVFEKSSVESSEIEFDKINKF